MKLMYKKHKAETVTLKRQLKVRYVTLTHHPPALRSSLSAAVSLLRYCLCPRLTRRYVLPLPPPPA